MDYRWILFSFLSLFSLVVNYLLNKGLANHYSPLLALTITGVAQAIISWILFMFSNETLAGLTKPNVLMAVGIALCVLGIDWSMMAAYKMGGNSVVITLIVSMATVIMLPISYFIFKEKISFIQLIGVLLSFVSIFLVVMFPKK